MAWTTQAGRLRPSGSATTSASGCPWRSLLEAPADRPVPAPTGSRLRRADYLVGDPAAALVELHRQVRFDQFAFWARLPGHTDEQALRSMRLFAAEVEPAVRRSMANR